MDDQTEGEDQAKQTQITGRIFGNFSCRQMDDDRAHCDAEQGQADRHEREMIEGRRAHDAGGQKFKQQHCEGNQKETGECVLI